MYGVGGLAMWVCAGTHRLLNCICFAQEVVDRSRNVKSMKHDGDGLTASLRKFIVLSKDVAFDLTWFLQRARKHTYNVNSALNLYKDLRHGR